MARVIAEADIDFAAYYRDTEPKVKVRKASVFADEMVAELSQHQRPRRASMTSTKLGKVIEFRPGETTAWSGYNGSRKSMFTGQVMLDLCTQNQRVLSMSMEMQPARTLARMARQACGIGRPSEAWARQFATWTDGRLWMFDHLGRITPQLCIAVLRYFAEELKGTQVFIDSMMMVCASEEHLDEQKQLMTDLVRVGQETNAHVHLVTHCRKPQNGDDRPPSKYDMRGSAAISDQADNVITVWKNSAKKAKQDQANACGFAVDDALLEEPDAIVGVEKQRNGEWEGKLKLWFDEGSLRFMNDRMSPVDPYWLDSGTHETQEVSI